MRQKVTSTKSGLWDCAGWACVPVARGGGAVVPAILLALVLGCCSCQSYRQMRYEELRRDADVCVAWKNTNVFEVDGRTFGSTHGDEFRAYVDAKYAKRDVAWVDVGKLAAVHDPSGAMQRDVAVQLRTLGFKRVICKMALSTERFVVSYDSEADREMRGARSHGHKGAGRNKQQMD